MNFNIINKNTWSRKEYFDHYINNIPCTFSITVNLDITNYKNQDHFKLYPLMLHSITTIINRHQEFRISFDENKKLGFFDTLNPCFTIFHKDTETFSNIWTEYNQDINIFHYHYQKDLKDFGHIKSMIAKPITTPNIVSISCIPWVNFTAFNLNLQKGFNYLLPIFTIGKYIQDQHKTFLPLSIQAHHAVCDGFHVSRFINELQELINKTTF